MTPEKSTTRVGEVSDASPTQPLCFKGSGNRCYCRKCQDARADDELAANDEKDQLNRERQYEREEEASQ